MKYTQPIVGERVNIRLATFADAQFLFDIRSDPSLTQYLPPIQDYVAHCAWLKKNLSREDDYLFIVEEKQTSRSVGVIAIHDIAFKRSEGLIGRWIMEQGSKLGFEAIYLAYTLAFEILGLERILTETLVENKPVLSFHLAVGLKKTKILEHPWKLRGKEYFVQQLAISKDEWPQVASRILKLDSIMA